MEIKSNYKYILDLVITSQHIILYIEICSVGQRGTLAYLSFHQYFAIHANNGFLK